VAIPLHDDNPSGEFPILTVLLIAINILVFALIQPHEASRDFVFSYERAVIPCEIRNQAPLSEAELVSGDCGRTRATFQGETYGERPFAKEKNIWLSMLTSLFLHGSWIHLLGNMLFLWVFGNNIEERFGRVGFLAFFATAGVVATIAQVLVEPGSTIPIVGASGAIAGVMGAYLVLFPRARILTWWPMFVILVVYIPAAVVLGLWFLMQFAIDPNSGVAWAAHVGGFIFGAFVAVVLRAHLKPLPIITERSGSTKRLGHLQARSAFKPNPTYRPLNSPIIYDQSGLGDWGPPKLPPHSEPEREWRPLDPPDDK
jgi:membrane associated rhomboid family serine protease